MKTVLLLCLVLLMQPEKSLSQSTYEDILRNLSEETKIKLSPACQDDLKKISFSSPAYWLMVDSSSRIPSGIAQGNLFPMGNYDECLAIGDPQTKFCKTTFKIKAPSKLQDLAPVRERINTELVGVAQTEDYVQIPGPYYCVLKSCSAEELNLIFYDFVHFEEDQCWSEDSKPNLDATAVVAILIFAIIALITVISTIYDCYLVYNDVTVPHPLLTAFSLYTNLKKLFTLGGAQQLQCLNGIKALSMLWVVLGHVYMAYVFVPLDNYRDIYDWLKSPRSQYIAGATVSVDTFLVIGGFLTIYSFQASMDKGTKFNVPLYYFHRYLRLTPALAAMLLAHAALFNYFGDGPVWQNTDTYLVNACKKYWWSTLLYVQNYANPNGTCIPQSWYLSVDMQLFLISPLILVLMRQWPKWGYFILSILSVLSMIASFLIGWFFKLDGQMSGNTSGNLTDYMTYYYMPTHTRMAPYLFGIMLGFAVYKIKNSGKRPAIKPVLVILAWIVSLALLATCIYSGSTLQFKEYDRVANSFFIALMRPVWSLALCWIIFACVMDYGGIVNQFLSLPVFQILARISYSVYLVHYSFIFMTNFTTRQPLHFSEYGAFNKFWGDLAISCTIAVLWTLVFESPVIILEKVLLGSKTKSVRDKKIAPV